MKQIISKFKLQVIKEKEYEYNCSNIPKASCPYDVKEICANILGLAKEPEEVFGMITLDTKNNLTGYFEVSRGTISSSMVHPREVFKRAILQNATSVILTHNHPSGDSQPSHEDIVLTNRLNECAKILGINLMDHIIIGDAYIEDYYSFNEEKLL